MPPRTYHTLLTLLQNGYDYSYPVNVEGWTAVGENADKKERPLSVHEINKLREVVEPHRVCVTPKLDKSEAKGVGFSSTGRLIIDFYDVVVYF